ncbi:MAG: hypothetical protein OHK0013_00300 [Sandaracinaceae bacterium]
MNSPQLNDHDGTPKDREIHRLFDGDLSPAERDALVAARGLAEVRAKVEGLGEVRAAVRAVAAQAENEAIDSEALWAQIAARIEGVGGERTSSSGAQPAPVEATEPGRAEPTRPALRVLPGGQDTPATSERGLRVRSRRTIMMIVGGLAAAAAAAIAYLGPADAPNEDPVVATTEVGSTDDLGPILDPTADEQLRRTEVIAVDFGAGAGTVFSVEGDEGSRYAVVWLTDEAEKDGATDPGGEHRHL